MEHKNGTYDGQLCPIIVNSLTAMGAHERPLFIELRGTVVSCQIFIHSQSLIAR
jgi:hypothetical protein